MTTTLATPVLRRIARDSETYRFIFSGSYQGVLLFGMGIEDCNEAACQLLGQARERLLGADPLTFAPATQRDGRPSAESSRQRVVAALAGHSQWFEWRFLREDGSTVDTLVNMEALHVDGTKRLLLRLRDVSHLERSEEALHKAAIAISTIWSGISHIASMPTLRSSRCRRKAIRAACACSRSMWTEN
jgi:PAS domain S-box-containing protein